MAHAPLVGMLNIASVQETSLSALRGILPLHHPFSLHTFKFRHSAAPPPLSLNSASAIPKKGQTNQKHDLDFSARTPIPLFPPQHRLPPPPPPPPPPALPALLIPCHLNNFIYLLIPIFLSSRRLLGSRRHLAVAAATTLMANSVPPKNGVYIVGDFMTRKEELHVVKPTTTVDEALDLLVENRITGFPVIDDDWKLLAGKEQNPDGMMGIQLSVACS
ncbi:hypothetical protein LguiB_019412 [Lonicera macranthoides]